MYRLLTLILKIKHQKPVTIVLVSKRWFSSQFKSFLIIIHFKGNASIGNNNLATKLSTSFNMFNILFIRYSYREPFLYLITLTVFKVNSKSTHIQVQSLMAYTFVVLPVWIKPWLLTINTKKTSSMTTLRNHRLTSIVRSLDAYFWRWRPFQKCPGRFIVTMSGQKPSWKLTLLLVLNLTKIISVWMRPKFYICLIWFTMRNMWKVKKESKLQLGLLFFWKVWNKVVISKESHFYR